jgi:hypothetical protein
MRDEIEAAPSWFRPALARQFLPSIERALREIPTRVRLLSAEYRRIARGLDGLRLPPDALPRVRPSDVRKARAAQIGFFVSVGLELIFGISIPILAFHVRVILALVIGLVFTLGLALLSKSVAGVLVDQDRANWWLRRLSVAVLAGWAATVISIVAVYLARNAVIPLWVLGVATPFLAAALTIQTAAYAAIWHLHSLPADIAREVGHLTDTRPALEGLRDDLVQIAHGRDVSRGGLGEEEESHRSNGHAAGRLRRNGRGTRIGTLTAYLLLWGLLLTGGSSARAEHADQPGIHRLVLMLDVSDSGEDTEEASRVRQLVADALPQFMKSLGDISEVRVLRWSDAASVWSAGTGFALPRTQRVDPDGEGAMDYFRFAADRAAGRERERAAALQAPVVAAASRMVREPPGRGAVRSCVFEALARAAAFPGGDAVVVVTDFEPHACPSRPQIASAGAVVAVIVVPQRRGVQTGVRTLDRTRDVVRFLPDAIVEASYSIDCSEALSRLAERLRDRAQEVRP